MQPCVLTAARWGGGCEHQSCVNSVDYLSMCLESKDSEKAASASHTGQAMDRSCWCLFRMSVHGAGGDAGKATHTHRDSYGRFAADAKHGDNTSLGWNDYMRMADFASDTAGYVRHHELPGLAHCCGMQ